MSDTPQTMVDISRELYIIEHEKRGALVKDAIYSALEKLNLAKSIPPIPPEPPTPADGHIYSGVGIRIASGKFTRRTGAIETVSSIDMMDTTSYQWEQGSSDTTSGDFTLNSARRIRCKSFIEIPSGTTLVKITTALKNNTKIYYRPYWYRSGSVADYDAESTKSGSFFFSENVMNIPEDMTHFRLVLSKQVSSVENFNPSELGSCLVEFLR